MNSSKTRIVVFIGNRVGNTCHVSFFPEFIVCVFSLGLECTLSLDETCHMFPGHISIDIQNIDNNLNDAAEIYDIF